MDCLLSNINLGLRMRDRPMVGHRITYDVSGQGVLIGKQPLRKLLSVCVPVNQQIRYDVIFNVLDQCAINSDKYSTHVPFLFCISSVLRMNTNSAKDIYHAEVYYHYLCLQFFCQRCCRYSLF